MPLPLPFWGIACPLVSAQTFTFTHSAVIPVQREVDLFLKAYPSVEMIEALITGL